VDVPTCNDYVDRHRSRSLCRTGSHSNRRNSAHEFRVTIQVP
jgi:hypothetical protein